MHSYIRLMDAVSRWCGVLASWALLAACLISAGNATMRYAFGITSNAWLEIQWYLFSWAVAVGAPTLLKLNEHVRVDVVYGGLKPRTRVWIDLLGILLVLVPVCAITAYLSWPFVMESYVQHETSPSAGGLIRWPVKIAIPIGFVLLGLQGLAELFKRIDYIKGGSVLDLHYERPLQ